VRPGLVAVGAVFALVGAAVIVGLVYPGDNPTVERGASDRVADLPGGEWRSIVVTAVASSPASVMFNWTASGLVNVTWYAAYNCTPAPHTCIVLPALQSWFASTSGHWAVSGTAYSVYEFEVVSSGSITSVTNFSATFTEQYRVSERSLPMIPFIVTMAGGSLLAGVGAVALYLGLFLPSGVYGPFDAPPKDELGPIDPQDPPEPSAPNRRVG
jgi:hypothetical protein